MRPILALALPLALLTALAGCHPANTAATARDTSTALATTGMSEARNWRLASLEVIVPQSLTVSEANTIKPNADIVWHEDPCCDRYAQVDRIMTDAMRRALSGLSGAQPVRVELQMTRFHAVTPRTRASFGGEHEIAFYLTVRDAASGAVLSGPRPVDIIFPAAGGEQALANEAAGYFQRHAIRDRVGAWARAEFAIAR